MPEVEQVMVFDLSAWDIWLVYGGNWRNRKCCRVGLINTTVVAVVALELEWSSGDDLGGGRTNKWDESDSRIAPNSIWTGVNNA